MNRTQIIDELERIQSDIDDLHEEGETKYNENEIEKAYKAVEQAINALCK